MIDAYDVMLRMVDTLLIDSAPHNYGSVLIDTKAKVNVCVPGITDRWTLSDFAWHVEAQTDAKMIRLNRDQALRVLRAFDAARDMRRFDTIDMVLCEGIKRTLGLK